MKKIIEKYNSIVNGKLGLSKKSGIVFIIGVIGVLLILISEFIPQNDQYTKEESSVSQDITSNNEYKDKIESQLKAILEKIDGVGSTEVMITLDGTTEYVYAEDLSTEDADDSDKSSKKYKNEVILVEEDGNQKALIKKIIEPKVTGVVVVCPGAGNIEIKERVIKAVSAALDISTSKICVEKS